MLKAVILDDELVGSQALEEKLQSHKDQLEVLAVFNDPLEALANIHQLSFDVLFLDIEMPFLNGFTFLEKLGSFHFEVVFVTAYNSYTLNALRLHVFDYLLKPVDEDELTETIKQLVDRVAEKKSPSISTTNNQLFLSNRIALSTLKGIHIIKHENIFRIEATGNYSNFYLIDSTKIVVSKTLRDFEVLLNNYPNFLRVNRSVIVNLEYVSRYRKGEGGTLLLTNGTEIEVSLSKKEELLKRLVI